MQNATSCTRRFDSLDLTTPAGEGRRATRRLAAASAGPYGQIRVDGRKHPQHSARNTPVLHGEPEQLAFLRRGMPVAATATARLVKLIILPITPPAEFDRRHHRGVEPQLFGRDDL